MNNHDKYFCKQIESQQRPNCSINTQKTNKQMFAHVSVTQKLASRRGNRTTRPKDNSPLINSPQDNSPHIQKTTRPTFRRQLAPPTRFEDVSSRVAGISLIANWLPFDSYLWSGTMLFWQIYQKFLYDLFFLEQLNSPFELLI